MRKWRNEVITLLCSIAFAGGCSEAGPLEPNQTRPNARVLNPTLASYEEAPFVTQEEWDSATMIFDWIQTGLNFSATGYGSSSPAYINAWSEARIVGVFVPSVQHIVSWTVVIDGNDASDLHQEGPTHIGQLGFAWTGLWTTVFNCNIRGHELIKGFSRHSGKYSASAEIQGVPIGLWWNLPEKREPEFGYEQSECPTLPECPEGQHEDGDPGCVGGEPDPGEGGGGGCSDGYCEDPCIDVTYTRYHWDFILQRYYAAYWWTVCEEIFN